MERIRFEDCEELSLHAIKRFESLQKLSRENEVIIIAKYEDARFILKTLLSESFEPCFIELESELLGDYDSEYAIILSKFDGTNELWCEKIKHDGEYVDVDASVAFILEDCSSKVISHCNSDLIYEVAIGEDSDDSDLSETENIHISRDKDGIPCGFMKTWTTRIGDTSSYSSYSYYSENLQHLKSVASDFGVKL